LAYGHYVEAETETHRTYSKRHEKEGVYVRPAGGGDGSHSLYNQCVLALFIQPKSEGECKKARHQTTVTGLPYFFEAMAHFTRQLACKYGTGAIVRKPTKLCRYPLDRRRSKLRSMCCLIAWNLTANRQYVGQEGKISFLFFFFKKPNSSLKTFPLPTLLLSEIFRDIENTWYYIVFTASSVPKYL